MNQADWKKRARKAFLIATKLPLKKE